MQLKRLLGYNFIKRLNVLFGKKKVNFVNVTIYIKIKYRDLVLFEHLMFFYK